MDARHIMNANELHRTEKILVDSGMARTFAEARDLFATYGVVIELPDSDGRAEESNPMLQTILNCAARTFAGNIAVRSPGAPSDALQPLLEPYVCTTAYDPAEMASCAARYNWPVISLSPDGQDAGVIHPWAEGWQFGLDRSRPSQAAHPTALIAAGALAVAEAFALMRRDHPYAGRRSVTQTLQLNDAPFTPVPTEPAQPLPDLWLLGLGHLGQAYAWTLAQSSYETGTLHLQDDDVVEWSNVSTSVLVNADDVGCQKTQVVGDWLSGHGFSVLTHPDRFTGHQSVDQAESMTALVGVDNPSARRGIEHVGFEFVIDGGLGAGVQDFQGIRIRTFPGPVQATEVWASPLQVDLTTQQASAYQHLLAGGAEQCGVTTLATRAVGAPFVGCYAAAHAISLLEQRLGGAPAPYLVDTHLRSPEILTRAFA
ncbi:MAG: ThiF family adenylyltransferase [Thalassospira sp.]|uniref:ThiF family adenylyltransferase n=1 Tax=Thalassospira sp. TaxID=1912094 RepID=UPI003A84C4F3